MKINNNTKNDKLSGKNNKKEKVHKNNGKNKLPFNPKENKFSKLNMKILNGKKGTSQYVN